jgi:transcriptional regulator with XRE-family HTH domain
MKTRLKDFMVYKSVNAAELADRINVQRSNVSHILNGRNYPGAQFIEKLLNAFPELDAGWLLTGHGSMLKELGSFQKAPPEKHVIIPPDDNELIRFPVRKKESTQAKSEKIDKIVVFYSDRTFREYNPE